MATTPQGLTEQQFTDLSAKVRSNAAHLGIDIFVHGSRATGTARSDSDLDIGIRVSAERFEQLVAESFGVPNPGSSKEKTMHHARKTGKVGLRSLRKTLEVDLGIKVDLSVICQNGPFDQGPFIPLP